MKEYVFLDGEYIEADKATIPVRTHAFLYGTGVFEGIRGYYNKDDDAVYVFRMKEHYERLLRSAKVMWMESPYTLEEYQQITIDLLKKNKQNLGVAVMPPRFR